MFDRGQAAHIESSNLAESFAPLKSPMSKCIDTIIGAGKLFIALSVRTLTQRSFLGIIFLTLLPPTCTFPTVQLYS